MEKKGHFPVKSLVGGRLSYLCPMPWHSETKPSFVVYTNSEYENFYCFGCLSKHNIIHLVSFLDNISRKQAIELLSDGVEFSIADEEQLLVEKALSEEQMQNIINTLPIKSPTDQVSSVLIEISEICQNFLRGVDNDVGEQERIDRVWTLIDVCLRDYDFEKIEKVRKEIGIMLSGQKVVFGEKWKQKQREELSGQNND